MKTIPIKMMVRAITLMAVAAFWITSRLPASATQQPVAFAPSTTDPAITKFDNEHYAVVNPDVANRGRLVLFLPGTGIAPLRYTEFMKNAAGLGFNALGLMYPNDAATTYLYTPSAPLDPDASE